jgi:hypothetical protein
VSKKFVATVVLGLFLSVPAFASVVPGDLVMDYTVSGTTHWWIRNTSVNLFEPPTAAGDPPAPFWPWGNNNWTPVDYPINPNYVPSPGSNEGEHFDLEGMFYSWSADNGGVLRVWLVTSMGPTGYYSSAWKRTYMLGDVFISTNPSSDVMFGAFDRMWVNSNQFEYVLLGPTHGANAGKIVALTSDDVLQGIYGPGSYANWGLIDDAANPWTWVSGANTPTGSKSLLYEEIRSNAGVGGIDERDENTPPNLVLSDGYNVHNTYVYLWEVPFAGGFTTGPIFHVTTECGNDVYEEIMLAPTTNSPPIPAPAALFLGGFGAGLVLLVKRLRDRR